MKTSITSDKVTLVQKEELATLISDATRKATRVSIDELSKRGVLNKGNVEKLRAKGNKITAAVMAVVKQKLFELTKPAENAMGIVRLISGVEILELDPTDGTETLVNSKNVFAVGVHHYDCSETDTNVPSVPTRKMKVAVYEMIKDGDFTKIFGSFNVKFDDLNLAESQVKQFCIKHRKWLRRRGYATFFLFKVDGEFFVADVVVYNDGRLEVCVHRFSYGYVWRGKLRRRIVVPQLELKN